MAEIAHRFIETNGIRLHVAEAGTGPLVILCHGFPESWYSWRHQLQALAEAGFHAVAPDMRGYGQTDRPEAIDQYTLLHLVGDMVGLVAALGADSAVIAGHDWGAPVAWHAAQLRPDRFRGVIGLSVPFRRRGVSRPTTVMPQTRDAVFYQLYFQEPGVAEAEYDRNVHAVFRVGMIGISGDAPAGGRPFGMVPRQGEPFRWNADPPPLPAWLSEADIDFYTGEFTRTGFRGGLNWYRNIDRNWELLVPFDGLRVAVPALYVTGDRDPVMRFPGMDRHVADLATLVPKLRRTITLPGCGHWTQQERPAEVNAAIIDFLRRF
ncbi:MAG TPA: alpha/beta hydrolase [Stellaceae bacterium]|nr:alpha/beta hydrolase [Stellaceae bacterium]